MVNKRGSDKRERTKLKPLSKCCLFCGCETWTQSKEILKIEN